MDWGMANRLSKTIKPDGRCFYLAMDHGYFQGPTHCLEKPGETAAPLLPYVDAVFMTRGVLRAAMNPAMDTPVILRVSGGNLPRHVENVDDSPGCQDCQNGRSVPAGKRFGQANDSRHGEQQERCQQRSHIPRFVRRARDGEEH